MKIKLLNITVLLCLCVFAYSKEPLIVVTKHKIDKVGESVSKTKLPDQEFRIGSADPKSDFSELIIPSYSSVSTRVADVNISNNRVEVAIQFDEFYIEYSDYSLVNGKWKLKLKRNVCNLSGLLARRIAVVEIREGGIVEIKYHERNTENKVSNWENELIQKIHRDNNKLLIERYILKNDKFQLIGKSVRLRPQK